MEEIYFSIMRPNSENIFYFENSRYKSDWWCNVRKSLTAITKQ